MDLKIERKTSLAQHTTLKVGGVADFFVEVSSLADLLESVRFARESALDIFVLGGGSNVLVSDEGYRGLVIKNSIKGIEYQNLNSDVLVKVGAGEYWDHLVLDSVEKGYWGIENLSSIPGTTGATPVQNVGAYGVEVSELIEAVEALNIDTQEAKTFSNKECEFGYRDSFFKTQEGRRWIIHSVTFRVSSEANPKLSYAALNDLVDTENLTPLVVRDKVRQIRSGKFPDLSKVGTAGSFFKNPIIGKEDADRLKDLYPDLPCYEAGEGEVKVSLGWILDNVCQLKGYCEDGVCLYKNQALVLVNESATNSENINNFANKVAAVVEKKTGIKIEREVRSL